MNRLVRSDRKAPPGEHADRARPLFGEPRQARPPRAHPRPRLAAPPATYRGIVVDGRDGSPIAQAAVRLCAHDPCEQDPLAQTESNDDGGFEIERDDDAAVELPAVLLVRADGFLEAALSGAGLGAATRPGGLEITLEPAPRLHGRVLGPDGEPVAHAQVGAFRGPQPDQEPEETGAAGEYLLASVPAGAVTVYALAEDGEQVRAALAHVSLQAGDDRALDLTLAELEPRKATGRVVDRAGRPLAWIKLTMEEPAPASDLDRLLAWRIGHESRSTDLDGAFVLPLASAGPHHVKLWAWSSELGQLLGQADLFATENGRDDLITVWDPDVVHCWLVDAGGRPTRIGSYSVSYRTNDDALTAMGGVGGGGLSDGWLDGLSFVWARYFASMSVQLHRGGAGGRVELHGPADRCEVRAQR